MESSRKKQYLFLKAEMMKHITWTSRFSEKKNIFTIFFSEISIILLADIHLLAMDFS